MPLPFLRAHAKQFRGRSARRRWIALSLTLLAKTKSEASLRAKSYVVVELCPGRQTSSRFSTMVTTESIAITKIARISMPENTPVTSKTLSASWIL